MTNPKTRSISPAGFVGLAALSDREAAICTSKSPPSGAVAGLSEFEASQAARRGCQDDSGQVLSAL
jgi:hypothetical protein